MEEKEMETKRIIPNQAGYKQAGDLLANGGIVAMPTETVYGLAASAYDDAAIARVFAAKGRPQDNPLIVHIADLSMLPWVTSQVSEQAKRCAEAFWPGPFTMVLPKGERIADSVCAGLDSVGVRMPSSLIARELIRAAGLPLAAPSANRSGLPSPISADHVLRDLDGSIDAVLMGPRCEVGVESTVISLTAHPPRLLRPGAVTLEQLKTVLPDIEVDPAVLDRPKEGEQVASPGMKYKHYAPKATLIMVEGDREQYCRYVNEQADGVAVCFKEDVARLGVPVYCYGASDDGRTQAYALFEVLRRLDEDRIEKAYLHAPGQTGVGLAVYNRAIRSCGYRKVVL